MYIAESIVWKSTVWLSWL